MTATTDRGATVQPLIDLHGLAAGIRWHRRTWMTLALLGLIVGATLSVVLPTPPTAVARVLVVRDEADQETLRASLMATDIAVLQTIRIAEAALQKLDSDERPDRFIREYSALAVTSDVLELTMHAKSDQEAVARAQALLDVFIADRAQRALDTANAEAEAIQNRRAEAQQELAQLAAPPPSGADLRALNEQRDLLTRQIQALDQQLLEVSAGAPQVVAGTQLVDPPHAVSRSLLSAGLLSAAIGLVIGLGVGLIVAAVLTVVRNRPVLRRDIAADLGASVIAQLPERRRLLERRLKGSRLVAERKRVAATLSRVLRDSAAGVSMLELGCARLTASLALDVAAELASAWPVTVVDDLPGREVRRLAANSEAEIEVLDGADYPPGEQPPAPRRQLRLGIGSVRPGAAWTDLPRLGAETVLVVRAGHADASWLHNVARQLAESKIAVVGVVLVHPDPRDRSDGTLWDGLHTALRGRASRPAPDPDEAPASGPETLLESDIAHVIGSSDAGTSTNGHEGGTPSAVSAKQDNGEGP